MNTRSWQIITAIIALLVGIYSGASYWCGLKAEATLNEQYVQLSKLPFFKVVKHSYQRGWFTSIETTELTFNQKLFQPYLNILPANSRDWLNNTISYTNTIRHGPLPEFGSFGLRPARAVVTTEFSMSPQTRDTLAKFFGDKPPITLVNRLYFSGGGLLSIAVPQFDYEEPLSGIKINWKGLNSDIDYAAGYQSYSTTTRIPGFSLSASSKGRFELNQLAFQSNTHPGVTGVNVGASTLTISTLNLESKESIPYQIKLNELINLLTRMHVGEFINPSGEFKPSQAQLTGLRYEIVTNEQNPFINTRGKLSFDSLSVNQQAIGPMRLDVSANHLHGPTLLKLDKALSDIQVEGIDPAILRKQYIDTVTHVGLPLLENDPKLVVNDFYLKLANGEVKATGSLALQGFTQVDLSTPLNFFKRVDGQLDLNLPRKTLENLVVAQARNLFMVDASAENPPSVDDIDNLAKNLLDSQLSNWIAQDYIKQTEQQLLTNIVWKLGNLSINGHPVLLPWQEPLPVAEEKQNQSVK